MYPKARRKGYSWPRVNAIHPECGSFQFSVHGVRSAAGSVTLMAFHGGPEADQTKMVDVVFDTARGTRSRVIQLSEDDISEALALFVAAQAEAHPDTGVLILAGAEWGIVDPPAGHLN